MKVMGIAILPSRLKEELFAIEQVLTGKEAEITAYYQDWTRELIQNM